MVASVIFTTGVFIFVITTLVFVGLSSTQDPEHQRAKGNLKYFEFQLEKQKKAEQNEPQKETKREERDTTEKKKPQQKKESFQLIPERKKYEMLCRGEGIKMVRQREDTEKWSYLQNIH